MICNNATFVIDKIWCSLKLLDSDIKKSCWMYMDSMIFFNQQCNEWRFTKIHLFFLYHKWVISKFKKYHICNCRKSSFLCSLCRSMKVNFTWSFVTLDQHHMSQRMTSPPIWSADSTELQKLVSSSRIV